MNINFYAYLDNDLVALIFGLIILFVAYRLFIPAEKYVVRQLKANYQKITAPKTEQNSDE